MIRFLKNFPALFIQEIKTIVIADLHVGIEYELYKSGIRIPSQVAEMKKNIFDLIKKTKAKRLVILGDLKHDVPGISYQEMKEIPGLMKDLSQKIKVDVCLGNHDTYIKKLSPEEIKIHGSEGFKIERFGFIHGHAWPSKELLSCDCLITGHTHPVIQFTDKFGYRIIEPVWIKNKIDKEKIKQRYKVETTGKMEFIIMPAFNRLLGGTPVNVKRNNDELLGPLLKNNFVDMNESEIYLLDGTYLGKLKNLVD
ncbi:MAG: metallophosphoesterase [Candidatus Aenigmarchaeota archaeon]|nr:metallophosphoesterase [Candidatus Aenigmarchaeota archaeon]